MNEQIGVSRHARGTLEVDGESAKIRFSPEVRRTFTELADSLRNGKGFDRDMLTTLDELASGKNYSVKSALSNIAHIVQETSQFVHRTDDERAGLALLDVFDKLMGSRANSKPVTVVVSRERTR